MIRQSLVNEAREFYEARLDEKRAIPMVWAVSEIIRAHESVENSDREWWETCAQVAVYAAVSEVVRKIKAAEDEPDSEAEQESLFPGYRHLQRRYIVERNEDQVTVPVELLTDEEIDAKILEHERQSAGHLSHAQELMRFKSERRTAA